MSSVTNDVRIRVQLRDLLLVVMVALLMIGGAYSLKEGYRQGFLRDGRWSAVLSSEPAHVVAHLLLYGGLTVCCGRLWRWHTPLVVFSVFAVALAQELAQVLPFGRVFGRPALFDLCVDAVAVAAVLFLRQQYTLRRSRKQLARL